MLLAISLKHKFFGKINALTKFYILSINETKKWKNEKKSCFYSITKLKKTNDYYDLDS